MSAVDDPRTAPARERPSTGSEALSAKRPEPVGDPQIIRIPRLLVAASEISWRLIVCIAALSVVVYGLLQVGFALIPVIIALLLSTLLVPLADRLHRRGLPRALATTIVFVGSLLLIAGVVALVAPAAADEFGKLGDQVREGADELGAYVADLPLGLEERQIQEQIDSIDDRVRENQTSIQSGVVSGAQAAGQFLAALAICLVVLFFFIKDGAGMWRWLVGLFPDARKAALDELGERSWHVLTAYVRGVVFVAFVDAVGIGLALFLIGVPLVLPLALITFILAFVPLLGAIVAGAAAALVALVAVGPTAALLVIGAVILVQQVEGNILYPMIVGRTVSLHPVAVFLAVTIGGLLYGIVGAALAVPIATVAAATIKVVDRHSVHGEVAVGPPPVQDDQPAAAS